MNRYIIVFTIMTIVFLPLGIITVCPRPRTEIPVLVLLSPMTD